MKLNKRQIEVLQGVLSLAIEKNNTQLNESPAPKVVKQLLKDRKEFSEIYIYLNRMQGK